MRLISNARLSARARQLINKSDRTAAEDAEVQRLLMAHMDKLRERDERARQWRRRRDRVITHVAPVWEAVAVPILAPVAIVWNAMVLALHDGLNALSRRLRRGRHER